MSKHRTRTTGWRRLLSGVLCLALTLGLLPAAGLVQIVGAAHWADPYGEQLVEWGIMNPSLDLRLGDEITRAEFVAMCNRTFGYKKLGGTPFIDVPSSEWYAQDIDIAYNVGYFKGTSSDPENPKASPSEPLTREQAAVLLSRNMMLQETVGESLGFSDSRDLSEWSRGLIGAAVEQGVVSGYSDGSFRPFDNITRGEVAAMLVRAIGTPISREGSYELGSAYGNVTISSSNVTLRDTVILGNLYVTGGVDLGNVLLENVTVLGRIILSGGGESDAARSSVVLRNVEADEMLVDSMVGQFVTVSTYGLTNIPLTTVRSDAYLEDSSSPGYGLDRIELAGERGTKLQLAGTIKEVVNKTPYSDLQLVKGTAERITIDEYARNSQVLVDINTQVEEMNLDVATLVTGKGDIINLHIGADGCEVDILPESVEVRPGISATVNGEVIGSVAASELSSEPRLLAGYPGVTKVTPSQAEGLFSGNKPGTIYWAVSELADGSVSMEDLLNNPAYGGNIFEDQAGSISASAKTEYGRQISDLVPGGSYYLSAVLVDGRENRSPLKVMSFTTPDDTVPAFVGDPYMSKTTCETAQVTATANKDCLLFYAVLTRGAEAPTPQEFKTGSIGGNYGYGSVNMVKNVPVSINVNRSRLAEKTTYWLYLWLTDEDGVQSMETPVRLEFTTPDETPPIVSVPIQTAVGESTAGISFSINEAPSVLYWAVVAEGDGTFISSGADMTSLRTKMKVESGAGAIASSGANGTAAAGANLETLFTITGLNTATTKTNNYIMYYVAKDAAGNYSERVGYIRIRTLDREPPTVSMEFTDAPDGKPRASSDVMLVFTEQVKGGPDPSSEITGTGPVTFLDYYNQVLAAAGSAQTQQEAKRKMAEELARHIKLYSVPRTGQPVQVTPLHELELTADADIENWVIDWREAVITMDAEGKVVITLAAEKALRMDSGATYYFQLLSVYDNAYTPNGVAGDPNGNYKMENFTTVYAQVELRQYPSLTSIGSGVYEGIRLDMCVDVIPESTSKVPDTEYWDMIMWSDTSIAVLIYRQEIDDETKEAGEWVLLNKVDIDGEPVPVPIREYTSNSAIGLGDQRLATGGQFGVVRETLKEKHTYRYGIHITRLGVTSEDNPYAEPESWGSEVTMRFSLIAGSLANVRNVTTAANVETRYATAVGSTDPNVQVSEIGIVYPVGMGSILSYSRTFRDTRVPTFRGNYPEFDVGSGSINVKVQLNRAGYAYVVVAEAAKMYPTITGADQIGTKYDTVNGLDYYTDGRHTDGFVKADKERMLAEMCNLAGGRTYIPTTGGDRDTYARFIEYMDYEDGDVSLAGKNYHSPDYLQIVNPRDFGLDRSEGVYVLDGPMEYQISEASTVFSGLKPDTVYYVYFVLQGDGNPGQTVECYRVKTTEVNVPSITVTGTTTTATMTPDQDCELTFALVEYNNLPEYIKGSVLTQMSTRASGTTGPSVFDETADENLKQRVATYIAGQGGGTDTSKAGWWQLPDGQTHGGVLYKDSVPANTSVMWDFMEENKMTSLSSEYVLLVVARHIYGGTSGSDYGFSAVRGLYTPDTEPPDFKPPVYPTPGILMLAGYTVRNGTYSGTVTLNFTKDVYYLSGYTRYSVVYGGANASQNQKNIRDILGGAASRVVAGSGSVGSVITLQLNGIAPGEQIVFFSGGTICNASGYDTKQTLTLTFNPYLRNSDFFGEAVTDIITTPGFTWTWG